MARSGFSCFDNNDDDDDNADDDEISEALAGFLLKSSGCSSAAAPPAPVAAVATTSGDASRFIADAGGIAAAVAVGVDWDCDVLSGLIDDEEVEEVALLSGLPVLATGAEAATAAAAALDIGV